MVAITLDPLVLKNCNMIIEEDDFAEAVTGVTFTPSASAISIKTMSPNGSFSDTGKATWVLAVAYVQDWNTEGSLANYLYDNEGETKRAIFRPEAGGVGWEADVVILPGAIGGSVDTYGVATATLGCKGRPTRVAAPEAPAVPVTP